MEPEPKQDHHQHDTPESQPESLTREQVRSSEGSDSGQEKERPPQSRARRRVKVGAWLQMLFNFLVVLFTGALVYLTYGQLEVAREATEATKKAADAAILAAETARGQLEEMKSSSADTKAVADAAKVQAENTEKLALAATEQSKATRDFADAAKSSARTADQALTLTHRPWVWVKYRIIQPLSFEGGWQGQMVLGVELENIGQSVAVEVDPWAELVPVNLESGPHSPIAIRNRHCDKLRRPDPRFSAGYVLFPGQQSPLVSTLVVAEEATVRRAVASAPAVTKGQIGFAVVGCVSYRASFESPTTPRHQTRFIYGLGQEGSTGAFGSTVFFAPQGAVPDLYLVLMPASTVAD